MKKITIILMLASLCLAGCTREAKKAESNLPAVKKEEADIMIELPEKPKAEKISSPDKPKKVSGADLPVTEVTLSGEEAPKAAPAPPPDQSGSPIPSMAEDIAEGAELFCLADTQADAEQIASLYGIELESYSYGVATFHTTEDPHAVIERGRAKGYPHIEINHVNTLFDGSADAGISAF